MFAWLLANAGSNEVTPEDSLYRKTDFSLFVELGLLHPAIIRMNNESAIKRISQI
jgi:hypothetical protein